MQINFITAIDIGPSHAQAGSRRDPDTNSPRAGGIRATFAAQPIHAGVRPMQPLQPLRHSNLQAGSGRSGRLRIPIEIPTIGLQPRRCRRLTRRLRLLLGLALALLGDPGDPNRPGSPGITQAVRDVQAQSNAGGCTACTSSGGSSQSYQSWRSRRPGRDPGDPGDPGDPLGDARTTIAVYRTANVTER